MSSAAGGGKQSFSITGSDSGDTGKTRGIAVRPNSATYKPSSNSPFSRESTPELKRPTSRVHEISSSSPFRVSVDTSTSPASSTSPSPTAAASEKRRTTPKANVPSADFPLSGNPERPTTATRKERDYKANEVSKNNPFSNKPADAKVPVSPERTPKANKVSTDSPFSANPQNKARKSSLVACPTPGAKKFNVITGEGAADAAKEVRSTPTFGYSKQSPFNPSPDPAPQPLQRSSSRGHIISDQSPFSKTEYVAPKSNRTTPKANVPDLNSPFSKGNVPTVVRQTSRINSSSADSPFNKSQPNDISPARNNNRVAPGGNTTFNIFEHKQ